MEAFRRVIPKVFHFREERVGGWVPVITNEFRAYKNKVELSAPYVIFGASTMSPTEFLESYGSSLPNLSFMAENGNCSQTDNYSDRRSVA